PNMVRAAQATETIPREVRANIGPLMDRPLRTRSTKRAARPSGRVGRYNNIASAALRAREAKPINARAIRAHRAKGKKPRIRGGTRRTCRVVRVSLKLPSAFSWDEAAGCAQSVVK